MATPDSPLVIALRFVDAINRRDLEALAGLMTADHVLDIAGEAPVSGIETLRAAWQGYFEAFPRYEIFIDDTAVDADRVAFLGSTTGSHLGLPDAEERMLPVVWTATVRHDRVARWSILEDSIELRRTLGLG